MRPLAGHGTCCLRHLDRVSRYPKNNKPLASVHPNRTSRSYGALFSCGSGRSIAVFSFPVTCPGDGSYQIVQGLNISAAKQEAIKATEAELVQEKADADDILAGGK